jgi:hypothetical protein
MKIKYGSEKLYHHREEKLQQTVWMVVSKDKFERAPVDEKQPTIKNNKLQKEKIHTGHRRKNRTAHSVPDVNENHRSEINEKPTI